jgi:hypothetical protein
MKKFYLFLVLVFTILNTQAQLQPSNYTMVPSAGTYTAIVGTSAGVAAVNNANVSAIPVGFTFKYMGQSYTTCNVSTSGFISFSAIPIGANGYMNNDLTAGGYGDMICPLWDDIALTATSDLTYTTTGAAPNRVFTVQWANVKWNNTATAAINFQVKLQETTNKITFVYQTLAGAVVTPSASVGITINAPNMGGGSSPIPVGQKFSSLSNLTAAATVSSGAEVNTIAVKPVDGQTYTFTPSSTVIPATPTTFTTSCVGSGSTKINWVDVATSESAYYIYSSTTAGVFPSTPDAVIGSGSTSYTFINLTPSTTYYYRIVAANEGGGFSANLDGSASTVASGGTTTAIASGSWGNCSTWSNGVPGSTDNVVIKNGFTVTFDLPANGSITNRTCRNLTIGDGITNGTLLFANVVQDELDVDGVLTVAAGSTLLVNTTGSRLNHILYLYGSVVNNGNINLSDGGTILTAKNINVSFKGITNQSITGTGTIDFSAITMDKGTGAISLASPFAEINTNFTIADATTDAAIGGGFLTPAGNGILKISGTSTISSRVFQSTAYNINSSFGFWLNNPNFTVTAQNGTSTLGGLLYVSSGNYNIGTASGNSLSISNNAIYKMTGGVTTIAGRFAVAAAANNVDFNMSAGTLTAGNLGQTSTSQYTFDLGTGSTGKYVMSGGTIVVARPGANATTLAGGVAYRTPNIFTTLAITGGTLQFGNATTPAGNTFIISGNTGVVAPNIVVNAFNNPSINITNNIETKIYGNLTLNGTGSFTIGSGAASFGDVNLIGNPTNVGDINNNGMAVKFGTDNGLKFTSSTGNQTYTQTAGTLGTTATEYMANILINNTFNGGGLVKFNVPYTIKYGTINTMVLLSNGILDVSNATIGTGGTDGYSMIRTNGSTIGAPNYNLGSGNKTVVYNGTTAQTSGGEWPTSPEMNEVSILNTAGVTINGDKYALNKLTLNGKLITGGNTFTLGADASNAGTLVYTSGQIVGTFKRWIDGTPSSYRFPMGDGANNLKNVVIDYAGGAPLFGGTLTTTWVGGFPANSPNPINLVEPAIAPVIINNVTSSGYWVVLPADGLNTGTYKGTFTSNGETGVADYLNTTLVKREGESFDWSLEGNFVTTTGSNTNPTVARSGLTDYGQFSIGISGGALPITIDYIKGNRIGNDNEITWKVNCISSPKVTLSIERSNDKINFTGVYTINADAVRCLQAFSFTDSKPLTGVNYYRLKMIDADGKVTYSAIIALLNTTTGFELVGLQPTLVLNTAILNITSAQKLKIELVVTDITGKLIQKSNNQLVQGSNQIPMNFEKIAAGTYQLTGYTSDGVVKTIRFIKQ